jgi:hypothetical protein
MEPTFKKYFRLCGHRLHAAWQAGEVIMTFLFAAVAGVVTYFGLGAIPDIQHWVVYAGTAVLTALYFVSVIQFQVWKAEARRIIKLEKQLTPLIDLDFKPEAEGIVPTRTEIYSHDGQKAVKVRDDHAMYIRITLICLSEKAIRGCAAFITKLEKGTVQGANFSEIPLHGSISLTPTPIDIYPRVQNVLDFLKVGEADGKLGGTTSWPFRLDGVFDDEGAYRFTIEVFGEGVAKTIRVLIVWTKRWDAITGAKVL